VRAGDGGRRAAGGGRLGGRLVGEHARGARLRVGTRGARDWGCEIRRRNLGGTATYTVGLPPRFGWSGAIGGGCAASNRQARA
jgi:hypothetical protein